MLKNKQNFIKPYWILEGTATLNLLTKYVNKGSQGSLFSLVSDFQLQNVNEDFLQKKH